MLLDKKGFLERNGVKGHSLKNVILPLLACPARKWLQIGTYMLLIITSVGDELLRGVNINDPESPK